MDDAPRHDPHRDVSGVSPRAVRASAALPPRARSTSGLDLRIGDEDDPVHARLCDWISPGAPHPRVLRAAVLRALASISLVLADSGRSRHGGVGWRRVLSPVLDRGRVASPAPSGGGGRRSCEDRTPPVQPPHRVVAQAASSAPTGTSRRGCIERPMTDTLRKPGIIRSIRS